MAVTVNAGNDARRFDGWAVDPFEIIVKEDLRGRRKPPSDEQIIDMAVSMMEHGQREPVECRKVNDKRLQLNLGFTRTAAARLIRDGFEYINPVTGEVERRQDEQFMLKVVLSDSNDKDAFVHNIVENQHRNATSAIDDAHNQRRLRENYGYSDADITKLFRYKDPNKVGRLRRLLALPDSVQDLVHYEKLTVQAALDLLDLPPDEMETAISSATDEATGNVVGSKVREIVREASLAKHEAAEAAAPAVPAPAGTGSVTLKDGTPSAPATPAPAGAAGSGLPSHVVNDDNRTPRPQTPPPSPPKFKPRSMKEFKAWCQRHIDGKLGKHPKTGEPQTKTVDPGQKALAKAMLQFLSGKLSVVKMDEALDALTDYERE